MNAQDTYIERLMSHKLAEEFIRFRQANRLSAEIQTVSALLLVFCVLLFGLSLQLGLPALFYILSGSIILGLLLAALITATVIHLWPRPTSFPDYGAIRNRIRKAEDEADEYEEYMDMMDGAADLLRKSLVRKRAILMAALICLYAAVACLIAAFVTGLCLWL